MPITDAPKARSNRIVIAGAAGVGLIITALAAVVASGPKTALLVETPDNERTIEISTYGAIGVGSGATPFGSAGDCLKSGGGSGKLMTYGTCGSGGGGSVNTGAILNAANDRFVNVSGDTMTGSLNILNGKNLQVAGTITGAVLKAVTSLNSSGTLVVKKRAGTATGNIMTIDTTGLVYDATNKRVGIGTAAPTSKLSVQANVGDNALFDFKASSGVFLVYANPNEMAMADAHDDSMFWFRQVGGENNYSFYGIGGTFAIDISGGTILNDFIIYNPNNNTVLDAEANVAFTHIDIFDEQDNKAFAFDARANTGNILKVLGTASGRVVFAENALRSSGSLVWEGAASGATLYVATSIKGSGLTDCDAANQTLAWDATTGRFSCGTDADTTYTAGQGLTLTSTALSLSATISGTLLAFQTVSGATVYATKSVRSSGSLTWEGAASGASLYLGGKLEGAGLTDCDADNQTVAWDSTTGRFSCGDDDSGGAGAPEIGTAAFSGAIQTVGDGRYVTTFGDTMTGQLIIDVTSGTPDTLGLKVINTLSGAVIHAEKSLTSSGPLLIDGANAGSAYGMMMGLRNNGAEYVQFLQSDGQNAFIVDTFSADSARLAMYNAAGSQTIQLTSEANDSFIQAGDFGINTNDPNVPGSGLEVVGIMSGVTLYATNSLASSGTLVFEGTASGSSLYLGTSLTGAGLSDCDADGQTVAWDASTGRFSCGDDDTGGVGSAPEVGTAAFSGAVQIVADTRYVKKQGDTMTGALTIDVTGGNRNTIGLKVINALSGAVVHAEMTLTSSGGFIWEGAASGSSLYVATSVEGAGLTDCDLATQTVAWDSTTKRFSCGTDSDTTYTAAQGLTLTSTAFSLSSTISGALLEFTTVSGATVYGQQSLRSSGSLVWEGSASGANLYVATSLQGLGLTDCDGATQTLNWDSTSGRFSCGTDSDTTYSAGRGLGLTSTSFTLNATITGSLVSFGTVSGTVLKAITSLASSGSLVWEGQGSGSALNLGGGNITVSKSGALVWNENSYAIDLRLEGDTDSGLLFLDASTDRIGIGTTTPDTKLDVVGTISGSSLVSVTAVSPMHMSAQVFNTGATLLAGTGWVMFTVPATASGFNVVGMQVDTHTAGTGLATFKLVNRDKANRSIFSTHPTIDANETSTLTAAAAQVVNASNDDVGGGDRLLFNILSLAGTSPKGVTATVILRKP